MQRHEFLDSLTSKKLLSFILTILGLALSRGAGAESLYSFPMDFTTKLELRAEVDGVQRSVQSFDVTLRSTVSLVVADDFSSAVLGLSQLTILGPTSSPTLEVVIDPFTTVEYSAEISNHSLSVPVLPMMLTASGGAFEYRGDAISSGAAFHSGVLLISGLGTSFSHAVELLPLVNAILSGPPFNGPALVSLDPTGVGLTANINVGLYFRPPSAPIAVATQFVAGHRVDISLLAPPLISGFPVGPAYLGGTASSVAPESAADSDFDGVFEAIDNCPAIPNASQADADRDGVGDACNDAIDVDGDEFSDSLDNCPADANPSQSDLDSDRIGDVCDPFPTVTDELALCQATLAVCLAAPVPDADSDGEPEVSDTCSGTSGGAPVDSSGCSQVQFCSRFAAQTANERRLCRRADWRNDEPVMSRAARDCDINAGLPGRADDVCAPTP